jgi:hypothetical protein
MKNLFLLIGILFALTACDKNKDENPVPEPVANTKPVITLNGANPFVLSLNQTYTEPGATANDAEDGNISSQVITSGTINNNKIGSYSIKYVITDKGGLKDSAFRTVKVQNDAIGFKGNYQCTLMDSVNNVILTYNDSIVICDELNGKVLMWNFAGIYQGMRVYFIINTSNHTITIPEQNGLGGYTITFKGSGYYTPGNPIFLDFNEVRSGYFNRNRILKLIKI